MNAIEFIRKTLDFSTGATFGLIEDLKEDLFETPLPAGAGNHAAWILGHLIFAEAGITNTLVQDKPNPLADWAATLGKGSKPTSDPAAYPSYEEMMATFKTVRAATEELLNNLSDEDLDKPSPGANEGQRAFFGTIGDCFKMLCLHYAIHRGQLADIRLRLNRTPLMA